ncbi:phenylalanine--tRNA ligase subunit beta [Aquimarina sp. ERC-38]|uniref:phenylalanine--tRNA ligase subunit beta n=1 Tax=Aquimarina sp. ERC-38 TaxID=2949996 RepID=UPI002246813C|nr:phenylalanine--tRNA ligase subunit beta [Aquimarina sp. ERC-38]UZO79886.1 phenylalanine--tRNA ligase subunit beta [Aquimarina sp. ERC-38]
MKISYNWLQQFIKPDWDIEKTGELLTDLGLEVEGISTYESIKGSLRGVVVGEVLACEPHSNADKLKVTKVDIGTESPVQIVCGAPNVAKGQKVPVATIGTTLYTKEGEAWIIKKGKIRGEESHGMICAEDELGLGTSHDGILVLHASLQPGTPAADVFTIEEDSVIEIGLTPNRADAMSHWGVARDLKAGLIQQGEHYELITPSVSKFNVEGELRKISINVENKELAPRYTGLTISDVTVKASPDWLQSRLKAIGITPKNNIVDVTNYVLHELGQPLHAFDADQIKGEEIHVKTVESGTSFVTLDGVERTLHTDDLMICDTEKPLCIAGVFGGLHSGVSDQTTSIFLESAYFDPVSIRKTSKRHGLHTDASFRFERGIDPNITVYALKRAALLIQELAGGKITSQVEDLYPKKIEDKEVFLSFEKVTKLIGQELPQGTIKSILSSLEIQINHATESALGLSIPAYRNDVTREVDVIEEILRVYGYNAINFSTKLNASIASIDPYADHRIQDTIANQLIGQGFNEILANSLTSASYHQLTSSFDDAENVSILNPLSQDLAIMRRTLLFSGLESIAYNTNRKQSDLKLFEFGKTYNQKNGERSEQKRLSILISGEKFKENWKVTSDTTNFYYLKGIVHAILKRLGIEITNSEEVSLDIYNEALTYYHNKLELLNFGSVNTKILENLSIKNPVFYADIYWDTLVQLTKKSKITFKEISKYPEVRRDFALLLDKHIRFNEIEQIARSTERKLLKKIDLFDVYEGKNLPEGKKSYAVSFIFSDENKTLTDKQIDKVMKKLQHNFEQKLGASLR